LGIRRQSEIRKCCPAKIVAPKLVLKEVGVEKKSGQGRLTQKREMALRLRGTKNGKS